MIINGKNGFDNKNIGNTKLNYNNVFKSNYQ